MTRPNFATAIPGTTRSLYSDWTHTATALYATEQVSGVSRRKPKGWMPPTGYSFYRRVYSVAHGHQKYQVIPSNKSSLVGPIGNGGAFSSVNRWNSMLGVSTGAIDMLSGNAALVAARLKLKNKRVDLGVAYAERKATSRMLGDTATRLARSVRELQRGNFRNAARAIGIVKDPGRPRGSNWTNHWLQLQYGWKPLLSDVYGACDALSRRDPSDWRVTATASRKDKSYYSVYSPPGGTSTPTNMDAYRGEAVRERGVFVRLDALPANDLTMSFTSLGVTNPLLVAWELVPYSFVVDWFFPLGNWLDSLDALLGYGPAWSSISQRNYCTWFETGLSKYDYTTKGSFVENNYEGRQELLKIVRTAQSGVPLPTLPRFKDPRSLGHMANGLSLLAQAFGR